MTTVPTSCGASTRWRGTGCDYGMRSMAGNPYWTSRLPIRSHPGGRLRHKIQRAYEALRKRCPAPLACGLSSTKAILSLYQVSSRATEALLEPVRQWMGRVHMGLHDLQMWEKDTMGDTSSTGSTNSIYSLADIPGGVGDVDTRHRGRLLTQRS